MHMLTGTVQLRALTYSCSDPDSWPVPRRMYDAMYRTSLGLGDLAVAHPRHLAVYHLLALASSGHCPLVDTLAS